MGLFGAAHGWGAPKSVTHINTNMSHHTVISHNSVTHINNDETWHTYTLPKEDTKNIWITWHTPWVLLISAFFTEINKFLYIKKYKYRFYFDTLFLILLTFFESWKMFLIKIVTILIMLAKMATLGLLKIRY